MQSVIISLPEKCLRAFKQVSEGVKRCTWQTLCQAPVVRSGLCQHTLTMCKERAGSCRWHVSLNAQVITHAHTELGDLLVLAVSLTSRGPTQGSLFLLLPRQLHDSPTRQNRQTAGWPFAATAVPAGGKCYFKGITGTGVN